MAARLASTRAESADAVIECHKTNSCTYSGAGGCVYLARQGRVNEVQVRDEVRYEVRDAARDEVAARDNFPGRAEPGAKF